MHVRDFRKTLCNLCRDRAEVRGMTDVQKIVLVALLVLGALCVIVGLTLSHYIGGFLETVEKEAQEEAEAAEREKRGTGAEQNAEAQEKNL